jgi:lipopolysaccharide transport system ATP-binding protein
MAAVAGEAMLALENVSLSYPSRRTNFDHGSHHVLDKVSLTIYEGETLGIIGRNGVGKSTLLRLMAGILLPTRARFAVAAGSRSSPRETASA